MQETVMEAAQVAVWLGLPHGARVLIATPDAASWAPVLAHNGWIGVALESLGGLPRSTTRLDGAIVAGALERDEWDRWLLQRIRLRLGPGAPLLIVADNLWSLASPAHVARLSGRIVRELSPRIGQRLGRTPDAEALRFRGRLYTQARLKALLAPLGYGVERIEPAARFAARWHVLARAREHGVSGGKAPLAPCAEHIRAFEIDQARFIREREAWAARNPGAVPSAVRTLDPSSHAGDCAIVLAPHPDDEVIGAGGTLLRLVRAGCKVIVVQATDGSEGWALRDEPPDVRRTVRLLECEAVAAAAGFHETVFWRADNRSFRHSPTFVGELTRLFEREKPRLVFAPFLTDIHPDHLTLNRIAADAIIAAGDVLHDTLVLGYEVWALATPAVVCDVTDVREEQEELLLRYETAMKVDNFIDMCERRNYYNACRLLHRPGYAEAFHECAARDYPALVRATLGALDTPSPPA